MTTFTNKYSNYLHYKYNMIYSMKYTWVLYNQYLNIGSDASGNRNPYILDVYTIYKVA